MCGGAEGKLKLAVVSFDFPTGRKEAGQPTQGMKLGLRGTQNGCPFTSDKTHQILEMKPWKWAPFLCRAAVSVSQRAKRAFRPPLPPPPPHKTTKQRHEEKQHMANTPAVLVVDFLSYHRNSRLRRYRCHGDGQLWYHRNSYFPPGSEHLECFSAFGGSLSTMLALPPPHTQTNTHTHTIDLTT